MASLARYTRRSQVQIHHTYAYRVPDVELSLTWSFLSFQARLVFHLKHVKENEDSHCQSDKNLDLLSTLR